MVSRLVSGHAYCVESYVQPAEGASALRDVLRTRCVRRDEINALGLKSIRHADDLPDGRDRGDADAAVDTVARMEPTGRANARPMTGSAQSGAVLTR